MTTITETDVTQAIETLQVNILQIDEFDRDDSRRALAVLTTAARFAVEANQRLDALTAELAACRQMCQRVATEAGQGGVSTADLRALASAAEAWAGMLGSYRDNCDGLLEAIERAREAVSDDGGR